MGQQPCKVIPNGIDLECFRPIDRKLARDLLGLAPDRRYVLFGAMSSTSDSRKGFQFLQPALQALAAKPGHAAKTELLVFGANAPASPPNFGLPERYMGIMRDEISLALLYAAADVFVAPSMQDNLPNTLVEALACGTPCVAFEIGGMPDLVEHGYTGYLAKSFCTSELAQGICSVLEVDPDAYRRACRDKAERIFSDRSVARNYLSFYKEVLDGNHGIA